MQDVVLVTGYDYADTWPQTAQAALDEWRRRLRRTRSVRLEVVELPSGDYVWAVVVRRDVFERWWRRLSERQKALLIK